ncbi:MAG: rhodanese-like domain-containing protein [Deltaproteobacteria bacterium]|nr:rhodanese-like domain-containing protein [Deltaproteobacteria bacterium]
MTVVRKILFGLLFAAAFAVIATIPGSGLAEDSDMTPAKAYELMKKNSSTVLLDVRTPAEFNEGHVENAVNVDYLASDFKDKVSKLDKTKTYLLVCRSGKRSKGAQEVMLSLGFKKVINVSGGMNAWRSNNVPLK